MMSFRTRILALQGSACDIPCRLSLSPRQLGPIEAVDRCPTEDLARGCPSIRFAGWGLVPASSESEDVSDVSERVQFRVFGIEFRDEKIDSGHRKGASHGPCAEFR
jgi:hypothetical protein